LPAGSIETDQPARHAILKPRTVGGLEYKQRFGDDTEDKAMDENGTVFVTGGASGIGLAIAKAAVDQGWRVVIADLADSNLQQASRDLGQHE
jgi:NADPH:quinone reductase-like Zn-dependent oxidoreductase